MTLLISVYNLFYLLVSGLISLLELTCKVTSKLLGIDYSTACAGVCTVLVSFAGAGLFLLVLFLKLKFNLI
jgi:hypothetical protein